MSTQVQFDFLNTEADLAITLLRTAELEAPTDPAHSASALALAAHALGTIQKFLPRYQFTPDQIARLEERCAVIEDRINELRGPGAAAQP